MNRHSASMADVSCRLYSMGTGIIDSGRPNYPSRSADMWIEDTIEPDRTQTARQMHHHDAQRLWQSCALLIRWLHVNKLILSARLAR